MLKGLIYNLAFLKIRKIVLKRSQIINGPIMPPAGRIDLKNMLVRLGLKTFNFIMEYESFSGILATRVTKF